MTRRTADKHRTAPVEVRLLLPPDAYADLCSVAKVSGLAASQYARTLVLHHLNKLYAPKGETTQ